MKKPSAQKPTTQPRSKLVFFVDRSLGGRKLPNALRAMNLRVEAHDDHFNAEELDVTWLTFCGTRGWVVITKDFAIRGNPAEIAALDRAGVHAIFLRGRKQPVEYAVANFTAALPRILALLEGSSDPLHLIVTAGGKIEVVRPLRGHE